MKNMTENQMMDPLYVAGVNAGIEHLKTVLAIRLREQGQKERTYDLQNAMERAAKIVEEFE